MRFLLATAYVVLAPALVTAQLTQTLPRGLENVEGGRQESISFLLPRSQRWHWIYGASQFQAAGPIEITQIELRPDASISSWPSTSYPNVELSWGRTNLEMRSTSYLVNLDGVWDHGFPQSFFRGNLALPGGAGTSAPQPWTATVAGTPFVFDPRDGRDAVLEWRCPTPIARPWTSVDAGDTANAGGLIGSLLNATSIQATFADYGRVPVVRIHYRPAQAIHAAFRAGGSAIPIAIPPGSSVSFQDLSATPDPGGITSWEWDFDADGIVDSNAQHPTFLFTQCGATDIRLTARDATQASSTAIRRGYVRVVPPIPLRAAFAYQVTPTAGRCLLTIAYTDQSTGFPTRWAWDFESDGIVDSTLQHPAIRITTPGRRRVRLQVWNFCETSTIEREVADECNPADNCEGAILLTSLVNAGLTNADATDTPRTSVCYPPRSDVWYRVGISGGAMAASVCPTSGPPGFRPQIQVYVGDCSRLVPLACSEPACGASASAHFMTYGNQSYYLRVSDPQDLEGVFTVTLQTFQTGFGVLSRPFPGCGGAALQVQGSPRPGNNLTFQIAANGLPAAIWLGLGIEPIRLCPTPCFLVTQPHIFIAGTSTTFPIPNGTYVRNTRFYAQGAIAGAGGGCLFGAPITTTDTVQVDVQ